MTEIFIRSVRVLVPSFLDLVLGGDFADLSKFKLKRVCLREHRYIEFTSLLLEDPISVFHLLRMPYHLSEAME